MGRWTARYLPAIMVILTLASRTSGEDKKPKNSDIENIGSRDINKHNINFVSLDKEVAIGRALSRQLDQESRLLKDPTVNEYVNRVGQNILPPKDQYVESTSEFDRVKSYLAKIENNRSRGEVNQPTLHHKNQAPDSDNTPPQTPDDDRPTLKRN